MRVGYVKNAPGQGAGAQFALLQEQKVERMVIDMSEGKTADSEVFAEMMASLEKDDILVVECFSRLSENVKDFLSLFAALAQKGVFLVSLQEGLDTASGEGAAVASAFLALARLERDVLLSRQKEGIEKARLAGKYKGRKPVQFDEAQLAAVCRRWRAGEITAVAAMKELGLKPNTFYRRVKERGL